MTDLRVHLTENGADFLIENGDLVIDEGLEAGVIFSLFSDARVDPEEALPEETPTELDGREPPFVREVRGFWADTAADRWGSKLYLLSRAKATDETAQRAAEFVRSSLDWLLRDRIAAAVEVDADFEVLEADDGRREKVLVLEIRIRRGASPRWDELWAAIEGFAFDAPGVKIKLLAA